MDPAIEVQEQKVRAETAKLLEMHRNSKGHKIEDYMLETAVGLKPLSSFFVGKSELILIHNMGKKCVYCTLWGDGLTGFTPHLQNRASLLMVNGDDVITQTEFAKSRGWNFPMASSGKSPLAKDLGFHDNGSDQPGVSILVRDDKGQLWQKTSAMFGPGDIFCSLWSFVGMLPSNLDWAPKYKY